MEWSGQTVWITGASSGIGEALARECAARGARIVATARTEDALHRLSDTVNAEVHVVPADLSDLDSLPELTERVFRLVERVDVLILNAGMSQRSYAEETGTSVTRQIFALNVLSPIEVTRLSLPRMIAAGGGNIVPVSSLAGKAGFPLRSTYAATKHALHGYFEAVRAETYDRGIRVTIAVPGFVRTDISRHAVVGDGTLYGRMDENQAGGISPEACAKRILRAVDAGALEVRPGMGIRGRLALLLHTVAPRVFARTIRSVRPT